MIADRKITLPTAHRTNIATADAGPIISDDTGALTLDNQLHVVCCVECSAGGAAGTICLARWDKDGKFIGITEMQSFEAHSAWQSGRGYVAPPLIFDVMGAYKVKALVDTLSGGNITNLYLSPLSLYNY